jgi:oligopeptide transport system permease protein
MLGSSSTKIMIRNILPKILPVTVNNCAYAIPVGISLDATLSFLGFGYVGSGNVTTSLGFIIGDVTKGTD